MLHTCYVDQACATAVQVSEHLRQWHTIPRGPLCPALRKDS